MEGFDDPGVFFSDNLGVDQINLQAVKKSYKDFLKNFRSANFDYKYRDELKRNYNLGHYCIEINLHDLNITKAILCTNLKNNPTKYSPIVEEAAKELADELTTPRPEGEEKVEDIQVLLSSPEQSSSLRELTSSTVAKLVKIPGIVISTSSVKVKATKISIQCRSCRNIIPNLPVKPGLEGYVMPRKCNTEQAGRPKCPLDPYFIIPDKCKCIDYQVMKLQETPENIPQGQLPRHTTVYCERTLCERVAPGARVNVLGICSIKKFVKSKREGGKEGLVGVQSSYLRAVGLTAEVEVTGGLTPFTADEEEQFRSLAASPDIYEKIAKSIAPSVFGADDMKKAIAGLLFGGSRKRLPDGLTRRGDIHILLLGDPGTAKSQLLKFVEKVSPIGVYTSGKGSSAAGLTASVIRDPASRNFVMESGAMVLADGGAVCIDEFDKMREDDRVAIHEAMEQQTISIAKAGITTTLNSRCSVLAAANSVFGRWDDTKADDNIHFMSTILSRFDMKFIVKDEHDPTKDFTLGKHIISVHIGGHETGETAAGVLPLALLRRYVACRRARCGPRLSASAEELLRARYVLMRSGASEQERQTDELLSIPITVGWLRAEDQTVLSLHDRVALSPRYSVSLDTPSTWQLRIRPLRAEDRGRYMCQINTQPNMKWQIGCIDVYVPPDIINEETSSDVSVQEMDNITLICKATGHPTPKITWRREDHEPLLLKKAGFRDFYKVESYVGPSLPLWQVDRRQMGALLCIASNGVPPAVSKRITLNVNCLTESAVKQKSAYSGGVTDDISLQYMYFTFIILIITYFKDIQIIFN